MITLKADNRQLTKNAKFSYLSTNYASAISSIVVTNAVGFTDNDYLLLGEFGQENSEVVQINGSPNTTTQTIALEANTKFAHPQDTKVTIIRYNKVNFYQTAAATFDSGENDLGAIDLQADSVYTIYQDTVNSSGFGWFVFYNAETTGTSSNSNAIPYADFSEYSVKKIFDSFFSHLNNKEMKLINHDDAFRWLNEAYSIAQNELNLVNPEYKVTGEYTITTVAGTQEYTLPTDFSQMVSVTNEYGDEIKHIKLKKVPGQDYYGNYGTRNVSYFLRASTIGFAPIPDTIDDYNLYYQTKATALTTYYDNIDLPDNNFYPLVDHMLYRAYQKLGKQNPEANEQAFFTGINRMKVISQKQNSNLDRFEVDPLANL